MRSGTKPTLAVWKFASCDGCQLSLLDCELALFKFSHLGEYFWQDENLLRWLVDGSRYDDLSCRPFVDNARRWLSQTTRDEHPVVIRER